MSTYFKIDQALDNTTMRIIEDSIMLNPNIKEDDKAAIITSLCYSLPYEEKEQQTQRYTSPVKYKSITQKQVNTQAAASDLLESLKILMDALSRNGGSDTVAVTVAKKNARIAIEKAEK